MRLAAGDWFDALPVELKGRVDLVIANPPYVGQGEPLPAEVADWEPAGALVAGPTGLECVDEIPAEAPTWLRRSGLVVMEIAPHQAERAVALARTSGFGEGRPPRPHGPPPGPRGEVGAR